MSEKRDTEGMKSLKDLFDAEDRQEEEEIEKAKEGNTSSATAPTEIATNDAQGSSKNSFGESSDDKQGIDETHSDVFSQFELGEPSNRAGQEELQVCAPNPIRVGRYMGIFLFEVYLTPRDIELNRLFIPVEQALDYFPPLANRQNTYRELMKLHTNTLQMTATIEYDIQECVFVENDCWHFLVPWRHLKAWDVIRFFRQLDEPPQEFLITRPSPDNIFLIDFLQRDEEDIPGFLGFHPQNFLFQLMVTGVMYNRLLVPTEEVRRHFYALGIPAETHGIERLYFTDAAKDNWSIEVMSYGSTDPQYMLVMEDDFVNHYNLEDGHVIRFYKPDDPWSSRHFLIAFGEVETDSSLAATAGSDWNGDEGGAEADSSSTGTAGSDWNGTDSSSALFSD